MFPHQGPEILHGQLVRPLDSQILSAGAAALGGEQECQSPAGEGGTSGAVQEPAAGSRGTVRKGKHHLLPVGPRHRSGHCCWGYDSPGHATPAGDLRKGPVAAGKTSLWSDHLQNMWEVEGPRAALCSHSSCRPTARLCTATQIQPPIQHFSAKGLPSAVLFSSSWTLIPKRQISIPSSCSKQIRVVQVAQCLSQWRSAYLQGWRACRCSGPLFQCLATFMGMHFSLH